ncbi:MAG: undecaprenyl-diphosphate phosphatase [Thermoguttaceae bacterium]|nr:undecaprenyl-diphosphate phosphatase [Thermoguttaceae bacterium]MDW8038056.1 undecaprenyl-diphosphate phosphatase [Thermoguttaceae bacterium]
MWLEVVLLAVVQGIGEFLPISSSGHVVVGAALCDQWGHPIQEKLALNVMLHVGTLLSVLVFFYKRVLRLLVEEQRVVLLGLWATIPAVVVGLGGKIWGEEVLESPLIAGFGFLLTGVGLLWTKKVSPSNPEGKFCRQLKLREAFWIGLAQAFAVLPGISRSGATIVAGLAVGLRRSEAAAFSFLLAIPVMAGAGLVEGLEMLHENSNSLPFTYLGLGMGVSFLVGLAALAWLLRWLEEGRLYWFAYWLFAIGPVVLLWQIFSR